MTTTVDWQAEAEHLRRLLQQEREARTRAVGLLRQMQWVRGEHSTWFCFSCLVVRDTPHSETCEWVEAVA